MDWKKIRQAVRTVLAAVLICAASVGITGDPAYAADMGAVYGIYEHGTGWSGYHGDSKTARAGTGSYVTAIRASLLGQPDGMSAFLPGELKWKRMAFLAGKYDSEWKHRDRYAVRSGPHGIYRTACGEL